MQFEHPHIVQLTGRSIAEEPLHAVSMLLLDESEGVLYSYEPTEVELTGDFDTVMLFINEYIPGDFSLYIPSAETTVGGYITGVNLRLIAQRRTGQYKHASLCMDHILPVFTCPPQCLHGYNPYGVSKEITSMVNSIQSKNPILHAALREFSVEDLGLLFVSALFTISLDTHRTH